MNYIIHDLEENAKYQNIIIEIKESCQKGLVKYCNLTKMLNKLDELLTTDKYWPELSSNDIVKAITNFDLYIDVITNHIINRYVNMEPNDDLPIYCYLYVIIIKPFLYNVLGCMRTNTELQRFKVELLSLLEPIERENPTNANILKIKGLLEMNEFENYASATALQHFKYLADAVFAGGCQHILWSDINKRDDVSYILIHSSYNNKRKDSLFVMSNTRHNNFQQVLSEDFVRNAKFIIHPTSTYEATEPFSIVDGNIKPLKGIKNKSILLICYDDDKDLNKCHYTICAYPYFEDKFKGQLLSRQQVERKLDGEIYKCIDKETLYNLLDIDNASKIYDQPIEKKVDVEIQFQSIISQTFSATANYKEFSHKLYTSLLKTDIFQNDELVYVHAYIECYTGDYNMESLQKYFSELFTST